VPGDARHRLAGWTIDVLPPGADDPDEGYVGSPVLLPPHSAGSLHRFRRRFEELKSRASQPMALEYFKIQRAARGPATGRFGG
jgi:hypothetical protein